MTSSHSPSILETGNDADGIVIDQHAGLRPFFFGASPGAVTQKHEPPFKMLEPILRFGMRKAEVGGPKVSPAGLKRRIPRNTSWSAACSQLLIPARWTVARLNRIPEMLLIR